jgi:hypothetical protein
MSTNTLDKYLLLSVKIRYSYDDQELFDISEQLGIRLITLAKYAEILSS